MDLPMLDITNMLNKKHYIYGTIGNIEAYGQLAIDHIFAVNSKIYNSPTFEEIIFVSNKCDLQTIKDLYEKYYDDEYINKEYDKIVYFVMQKDIPMQLYIPEKSYTFISEYKNLFLLHDNIKKFYNKVVNFSQYYGKYSEFSKTIMEMFDEYKYLYYLHFILGVMYVLPKELNMEIMKLEYCIVNHNRAKYYKELLIKYHFI